MSNGYVYEKVGTIKTKCPWCGSECMANVSEVVATASSPSVRGMSQRTDFLCSKCFPESRTEPEGSRIWTAAVRFCDSKYGKIYDFMVDRTELGVQVGDYVVVECSTGIQMVKIERLSVGKTPNATKWVIGTIDLTNYRNKKLREEEVKKAKASLTKLRKDLDARAKAIIDHDTYMSLASKDAEFGKLYSEYLRLSSMVKE